MLGWALFISHSVCWTRHFARKAPLLPAPAVLNRNCLIIHTSDGTLRVWLPKRKPRENKERRKQFRERSLRRRLQQRKPRRKNLRCEPSPSAAKSRARRLLPRRLAAPKQPAYPRNAYVAKAKSSIR